MAGLEHDSLKISISMHLSSVILTL